MGFFKKLVDILFGTQKEYAVKDLGIFHSKVCDWWQNEHYNWWSTIQLPLYSTETVIWIEGDAHPSNTTIAGKSHSPLMIWIIVSVLFGKIILCEI